jgi:hypothetical protein
MIAVGAEDDTRKQTQIGTKKIRWRKKLRSFYRF